ncbi:MAG: 30S ribosomal protein S6 [Phycisphaerae bacterium]|nr:30S ribosomal protein S6 [Phycisphaerae bacterium]
MRRYEAMFLFDSSIVPDWASIEQEIKRLMERINGTLLVAIKYDERRLAYEIKRRKRGTYVLVYFEADTARISDLERDVRLSDLILRLLVLDGRGVTEARIAELRALPADQPLSPMVNEPRRGDDYGSGRPRRERWGRSDSAPPPPPAEVPVAAPAAAFADETTAR